MGVQLKHIKEYLEQEGYECVYVNNPNGDFLFVDIYIDGEVIRLKCTFPSSFPYEFPIIYILKEFYKKYQPLPHISDSGAICTFDTNKVFPNSKKPKELTLESIRKAEKILNCGILGENSEEFLDEFYAYWDLNSEVIGDLIFNPTDKPQKLLYYKGNDKFIYLSDKKSKLLNYLKYSKGWKINASKLKEALFLPILNNWQPPFPKTNNDIIELLKNEQHYNRYIDYMKNNKSRRVIIFSQKIDNSLCICGWEHKKEDTPNGFRINSIDPMYLYKNLYGDNTIKNIRVNQLGHNRLYNRGGDGAIKDGIKISITGCGSVGSYITKTLVDLGINNFTLIDNDELSPENTARHYCGASYYRYKKVDAIKEELLRHYPDIECKVIAENVFSVIESRISEFNECDYNFIAVGNIAIEEKFISLINNIKIDKPIIILWVEPYLIGGHALILQKPQDINFLFDENYAFKDRVITNGEEYIQKEAGCHSTFLPYSAFELQIFANEVVDFINTRLIEKNDKSNYSLSWGGRVDKIRRSKNGMKINSMWMASNGRELKIRRLDDETI